ncbi:MAG: aspartate aminotransferase family protein [Candidatus Freyarchaeota archaeon]|nr:aspartate aminotransferase family protein [Candidatus Freyrarchaeum guaymaensis]
MSKLSREKIIEFEERYQAKTYSKRPVVIVKGSGAIVWDENGREYIDCVGGHGVCVVGHCHPKVVEAIREQAERLITCPGIFYNDARAELVEKLVKIAPKGLNRVFLCNSGAEAVECAIKLARKYTGKKGIIATVKGFHGRTMGALSATWEAKYRKPFEPLVPGFTHVPFGDAEAVRAAINNETAAVLVEPIQGEGGVNVPPREYLKELREICDEKGVLLIFDEVQTGFGRTGEMFACMHWNVVPDVMTVAKAIAGGVPMGATLAREDVMLSLKETEHASTFGGNPLACAAANAAIDVIVEERLPERARKLGGILKEDLDEMKESSKLIRMVRGLGLMIGVELRLRCREYVFKAMERGILLLTSGLNVIRLLPPLVIEEEQVRRVSQVLSEVLVM